MESKHTIESPLKLTWYGGTYKVNKPNQETQELVSMDYAVTLINERNRMKETLSIIKGACFRCEKGVDKDWLMNQIDEVLKDTADGK